jgi:hypothetical protein
MGLILLMIVIGAALILVGCGVWVGIILVAETLATRPDASKPRAAKSTG